MMFEKLLTPLMVRVGCVKYGDQRPSITKNHYADRRPNSSRNISSDRAARSGSAFMMPEKDRLRSGAADGDAVGAVEAGECSLISCQTTARTALA